VVASQGLPKIDRCPSSRFFGFIIRKLVEYSQESTDTTTSCSVPSGLTTDRSANSSKVEVGYIDVMPSFRQVVVVKILIAAPKSTKAFEKVFPLICTVTIGFPRSSYLTGASLPDNRLDKVPTTWNVGLFIILLLGLFYT